MTLLKAAPRSNPNNLPSYRDWTASDLKIVDYPSTSSNETRVTLTSAGSTHTKGSWTEIIASSTALATMMRVRISNATSSNTVSSALVDVALGSDPADASAFNVLLAAGQAVADLSGGYTPDVTGVGGVEYWLPIKVPASTRVCARVQTGVASRTCQVHIALYSGTNRTVGAIDTIGTVSASSRGTTVAPGASNAEGSWVPITTATTASYGGIMFGVGMNGASTWTNNAVGLVDIGLGGSGSEVAFISEHQISALTTEAITVGVVRPRGMILPVGSRLSARIQHSVAAQSYDVLLYGLR